MIRATLHALRRRRSLPIAVALAVGAGCWTGSARADVRACIEQHGEGQVLRDNSRFLDARARFVSCGAEPACPDAIRVECADLLAQLDRAMPTVVLAARAQGRDLAGVRVELDGQPLDGALSGRAIPVDPGEHRFRFVAPDGRVKEVAIVAQETVKGRAVEAEFTAPAAPLAPSAATVALTPPPMASDVRPSSSSRALAYVFGGVGVAALAGAGYFAWSGRHQRNELGDSCSPSCTDAEVKPVRAKYLAADILLGVGVLGLGAGAYFYFSAPEPAHGQGLVTGVRGAF